MKEDIFNVFPYSLQCFTAEAREGLNLPPEYVLSSILYAASTAIGNTHQVRVKNGWFEGTNLFIAIVGETGTSKSHAISLAIKPLLKKNQEFYNIYTEKLKEYERYSKSKDNEEETFIERPQLQQLIVDDATLEAIYRIHHNNPKGIGVYYDELIGWFHNMGKYNKGSDQEIWLKIWSRKPVIVNRVSSIPISLMSPHISVIGGIQTKLLGELFKDNRDRNGFLERILFVKPSNSAKGCFPENDMPLSVLENYSQLINRLLDLQLSSPDQISIQPFIIELSSQARQLYKEYFNRNAAIVNSRNTDEKLKGFYPKIDTYTIRFSLILQLLYWVCGEEGKERISLRAMEGAITLANYFIQNANSVIESLEQPGELTNEHRKMLAHELYLKDNMSLREIGNIVGLSHETIRSYVNRFANDS
ncbi:DUF3987 domain-containing protein [Marinilabilia salmonicolor]|uniref:Uncharacterized protein DUF3987 n=1 Tax=Marinilabilia salmonicolor TaxID=989 RepID=A0A368V7H1_9BACT|nr:DUF3987 domain-containing protein [Marinilabilia salmonicolor]RCW36753.1 uncharacterized protein DUF3987 [Marinilabilia salmonicolor]